MNSDYYSYYAEKAKSESTQKQSSSVMRKLCRLVFMQADQTIYWRSLINQDNTCWSKGKGFADRKIVH